MFWWWVGIAVGLGWILFQAYVGRVCVRDHYEQQYRPDSKYRAGGVRTQWVCDSSVSRR
jgi:hypothetical protein